MAEAEIGGGMCFEDGGRSPKPQNMVPLEAEKGLKMDFPLGASERRAAD